MSGPTDGRTVLAMIFKRSGADETVLREQTTSGFRIGWMDSATGEVYDFLLDRQEDIHAALREDGIDPENFFKQVKSS